MTFPGICNYDATESAGDGIGPFDDPFLARNAAVGDSAGAMVTHQSLADVADMADMANICAGGGATLALLSHDGSTLGHHHPLQPFTNFPQHADAADSIPIDASLFDQLALTHSPFSSPVGVPGLSMAGAGHLLVPEGPPYPSSVPLIQESPWPETSAETHAWIADTVYRSGM